ncbi:glycosyltransferase family 2 protein, partial [Enterococcus faecalis]|nr:glycosyltransferase family 2 protein [Enterococcus faecalis]
IKKPKREYKIVEDKRRFLFLVPAHNEQSVIRETIETLLKQNYRRKLYDIVIIADNCTDNTANIVKEYKEKGVILFENYSEPDEPRGKPHAIAKFINTDKWKEYDFISFIDADNIVHPDYLKEMNSYSIFNPNLTVIQGYLGMKNVFSSITATGYAAVYFITNRAVQFANQRLGWNAAIGGTGFILKTEYLKEYGWNPKSYTEDFELQVELSISGKSSSWNHFAIVYDEKPNSVIASHRQRTRWAQGHWYVAITSTWKQVISLFKSKNLVELLSKLETLFYSYSMLRPVAFVCIFLLGVVDFRLMKYLPSLFSLLIFWLEMEILNFVVIPSIYFSQEAKPYFFMKKHFWYKFVFFLRLIIAFIWNSLTYIPAQLIGFGTWYLPQNKWKKTIHGTKFDYE